MATTTLPAPEAQPQAAIGPFGRIMGVFFSPKATFEDIARKPSWVVPMALLILISIGLSVTLVHRADWVEVTKEQITKSKFASRQIDQLSEDQKQMAYEQGAARSKIIQYVRGVVGWPCLLLIVSGVYLLAFKLIGGARTDYRTAFAIATFAHLPMGLRELIAIPVTLVKDPASIDPQNFLASNPAAIFGNDLATWQMIPLAFLDVFGLWAIALMAVGFSASDRKKLPSGKSFGIAFGVFFSMMLFFTMLAWVFS
jgi:Yip1-like protein